MGIDEAILIMENERPHCGDKLTFTEEERHEAYTWAIGALKELSSAQFEERTEERTKTHACDLIKRQDAIDKVEEWIETYNSGRGGKRERDAIKRVISGIKKLPAADRPQGEWIDAEIPLECGGSMPIQVCNHCKTFYPLAYTGGGHRFCPNCGCRMKGADDEND